MVWHDAEPTLEGTARYTIAGWENAFQMVPVYRDFVAVENEIAL